VLQAFTQPVPALAGVLRGTAAHGQPGLAVSVAPPRPPVSRLAAAVSRAINDTLQPVDFLGPFEVLDADTLGEPAGIL
jgi:hypothetical protein